MMQFIQLNNRQRSDAIAKIVAIAEQLNISLFGVSGGKLIKEALEKDANPDADFIFDEIDLDHVDVIYRENI